MPEAEPQELRTQPQVLVQALRASWNPSGSMGGLGQAGLP